jgi:hypothetical protein
VKKFGINWRSEIFLASSFVFVEIMQKTPPFCHFPIDKGGTRTLAHLPIAEGSSFQNLDRHIYDCKLRNEEKNLFYLRNDFSVFFTSDI